MFSAFKADELPPKPPNRMRWKTYRKLQSRYAALQRRWKLGLPPGLVCGFEQPEEPLNGLGRTIWQREPCLALFEVLFVPRSPCTLIFVWWSGVGHESAGRFEGVGRYGLAVRPLAPSVDHPQVATSLNNLSQLLYDTSRFVEAEALLRRALSIDESSLGPDHPDVALRLNNLARLLMTTNRLAEAEPMIRRALSSDEKTLGPEHPKVADRLNTLGSLLQAAGRLAEAEPLRALASRPPEHCFQSQQPGRVARLARRLGGCGGFG
jgi:tetratricopeptide (TPR) repeat protein